MTRLEIPCQVQVSEAHDALQAKEKEIRHLEKLQEEDHKRHSSLSSLRDQLDFNCRELNHQIQQLNAVNKEEQKKSTAIELRLEQVEAEAQYASSEAVQAARQQEFAFETLMARCGWVMTCHDAWDWVSQNSPTLQVSALLRLLIQICLFLSFLEHVILIP